MKKNYRHPIGDEFEQHKEKVKELYDEYYTPLYAFLIAQGCSSEDARDMVQDIFVKILEMSPDRFLEVLKEDDIIKYLIRMVKNKNIDIFRKAKVAQKYFEYIVYSEYKNLYSTSTENFYISKEHKALVNNAIEKILKEVKDTHPTRYEIFQLLRKGLPYADIALQLDKNKSTIGVEIKRVKNQIKNRLKEMNLVH